MAPVSSTHTTLLGMLSRTGRQSAHPATHPGDILYWAACLGGACLLLVFSIR